MGLGSPAIFKHHPSQDLLNITQWGWRDTNPFQLCGNGGGGGDRCVLYLSEIGM